MQNYEATVSYKLIYVFTIPDAKHEGCLKIGETSLDSARSYKQLTPNCEELNTAAHTRIDQYTKTALIDYELLHTELARRQVRLADGTEDWTVFSDNDVHNVLYASGYQSIKFSSTNQDSEWFRIDLNTAKVAIQAVKEGQPSLTAGEIAANSGDTDSGHALTRKPITLREEQRDCVSRTRTVFRTQDKMLWNCKMRFGKTVTAYSLIQAENYQKVIVVTHRPAVEAGWREDFALVFGKDSDREFYSKAYARKEDLFDPKIDADNDRTLRNFTASGQPFVYFASVQDLRHSAPVGGKYNKNNAVFEMDWDLIVYDEAHEGTQTELGQAVQQRWKRRRTGRSPKSSPSPAHLIISSGNMRKTSTPGTM